MLRLTVFLACIISAFAEAPLLEYGLPKINEAPYPASAPYPPSAPYPAAVPAETYGVPEVKYTRPVTPVISKYAYDIPQVVLKTAPYPAAIPVVKSGPYPAPDFVKVVKPHYTYGVPEVVHPKLAVPIQTKYAYDIPQVTLKLGPYPTAAPIIHDAPYPAAVKVYQPHDVYGVPNVEERKPIVPVITKYKYDIPIETPKIAPYPAPVPHDSYGLPAVTKVIVPQNTYGVPHSVYGVPNYS